MSLKPGSKICILLHALSVGGAERVFTQLSGFFSRSDMDVHLLCRTPNSALKDQLPQGVFYSAAKTGGLFDPDIRKSISELKPDVIITASNATHPIGAYMKRFSSLKIPTIASLSTHMTTLLNDDPLKLLKKPYYRWYMNAADMVVCPSQAIKDDINLNFGIRPTATEVIHNPVDVAKIEQLKNEPLPEGIDRAEGKLTLASAGRLVPAKNFGCAIDAVAKVKDIVHKYYIMGEGEERPALENRIKALGLEDTVILLGEVKNPYPVMNAADIYLLSSVREGLPVALLEAMALRTPVIASDCASGPREIITHNTTGLLCAFNDAQSLAAAIRELHSDKEKAGGLAEAAYTDVTQRFDLQVIGNRFLDAMGRAVDDN